FLEPRRMAEKATAVIQKPYLQGISTRSVELDVCRSLPAAGADRIMDMRSTGVEVRPIRQANGREEFCELFLTAVRIPAENMIGAENNGWRVAQATLASERGVISFEGGERQRYEIEAFYRKSLKDGAAWLRDAQLHREFVSFLAEMQAARRLLRRVLEESERPQASASVLPSIVKLSSTVLRQRICSFMVRIGGVDGQAFA